MIIFKNCSKRELDKNQLKSDEGEGEREALDQEKDAFVWSELMELGEW